MTKGYSREDKDDPAAEVHFCANCGSTTHFMLTPSAASKFGNVQMGVNMHLADEKDLAGVELRYPDGRTWPGKGSFSYVQEARVIGRCRFAWCARLLGRNRNGRLAIELAPADKRAKRRGDH